jgi:hypothetical protein
MYDMAPIVPVTEQGYEPYITQEFGRTTSYLLEKKARQSGRLGCKRVREVSPSQVALSSQGITTPLGRP